MPFLSVYIHFVWATKHRQPLLNSPEIRRDLWTHIKGYSWSQYGIVVDTVNGYRDHSHCLVSMAPKHSISKTIQLIKGESSHWINRQQFFRYNFSWQDEYYAASVSPEALAKTRQYILNQEQHHGTTTFDEELAVLLSSWGFRVHI